MYDRYRFDFVWLRKALLQTYVVFAGGSGRDNSAYQSAIAVADQLGAAFVEFPGYHVGYVTHPRAFAPQLCEVLAPASIP